ncbi:FimV/HubP family polar landmark protein [Thermomonas carbonis]|uniref:Ferrous iron transporter B n=1 Tax=Thermomonas carbonis TaxID=1463158 RepID=A0A7G9SQ31_9GAMM|nr:FimV/HubP family polar landmark protein [Thermomonas carbonis]QNN69956.1 ferrous iron transporter B [Thermomonas carbonis]
MIRTLRTAAIATALLLAAGNAWALGLGQIEVKSRRNQPLVAEIPIISTTPGELEALQARLASPETFRRVGLAPPSGVAADLQFSLGSDARGRPVIRVTSTRPVEQAVLNFLVEVDWGQGRLVREYSALVEAPNTASAPLQPAIEAPVSPAPNVVQRPVPLPVVATPTPEPPPVPEARPEPAPSPIAIAPLPPPAAAPAPIAAAPAPAAAQYGPIKQGETLSKIAGKLDLPSGYSLDQAMLALLRANPDAFLGDDINRLRRGSVLRVPGSDELGSVSADEAGQVVRQQMQQWRQARRPVRQPEIATADAASPTRAPRAAAPDAAPAPTTTVAAAKPKPATPPRQAAPARRQEARLQIIPPAAPGKATGTRSGTIAGGEGSMLQQQLRQKDEDIAAKAVEIGELKERVAELEKLKQDQQQLLSLKDSELAAAQQRLAEANKAAASAATAAVKPATTQAAPQASTEVPASQDAAASASNPMPYIWGGLGLAAVALLGWLLFGRRKPAPAPRRSSFDSEALAASLVHPSADPDAPRTVDTQSHADVHADADAASTEPETPPAVADAQPVPTIDLADVPPSSERVETPAWHSGWVKTEAFVPPPPVEQAAPRFMPVEDELPEPEVPVPQASAEQRMKLARAFLDIGDDHSAKQLLRELLDDADPVARTEAARLLREIG